MYRFALLYYLISPHLRFRVPGTPPQKESNYTVNRKRRDFQYAFAPTGCVAALWFPYHGACGPHRETDRPFGTNKQPIANYPRRNNLPVPFQCWSKSNANAGILLFFSRLSLQVEAKIYSSPLSNQASNFTKYCVSLARY